MPMTIMRMQRRREVKWDSVELQQSLALAVCFFFAWQLRQCTNSAAFASSVSQRDTSREHLITWTWEFLCAATTPTTSSSASGRGSWDVFTVLRRTIPKMRRQLTQKERKKSTRISSSQWDRWTSPWCQQHRRRDEEKVLENGFYCSFANNVNGGSTQKKTKKVYYQSTILCVICKRAKPAQECRMDLFLISSSSDVELSRICVFLYVVFFGMC